MKPGIAGFDNNTLLGGIANSALNQVGVVTSLLRSDGNAVQPFTGVEISKKEQQDAKFNNLVGVGGVIGKLGQAASFASQFITAPSKALFWSGLGRGGDKAASEVALKQEKITLEQLIKKNKVEMPIWDAANPKSVEAWQNASRSFAEGASGQVKVITGNKMRPGSIWETFELPALKANPNVYEIIQIDSATGLEKTILTRSPQ